MKFRNVSMLLKRNQSILLHFGPNCDTFSLVAVRKEQLETGKKSYYRTFTKKFQQGMDVQVCERAFRRIFDHRLMPFRKEEVDTSFLIGLGKNKKL